MRTAALVVSWLVTLAMTAAHATPVSAAEVLRTPEGFDLVTGNGPVFGDGPRRTYSVEVEPATGVEPTAFAGAVDAILGDNRSWASTADVSLERRGSTDVSIRVVLATPGTVDEFCARAGLDTAGIYSCWNGRFALINLDRWNSGASGFDGPLEAYRGYVINHEVGHGLGHSHVGCPAGGDPAPVMMQQTKGTGACEPNAWPFPSRSPGWLGGPFADVHGSAHEAATLALHTAGITRGCEPGRYCPAAPVRRDQLAALLDRATDTPPPARDAFTDDDGNPHEFSIDVLAEEGISHGCADGRYCPDAPVTRAQVASFLVRAFNLPLAEKSSFADTDGLAHAAAIDALAAAGISRGCADGRYCPVALVTRGQMATLLARALELQMPQASEGAHR